ncbi:MAG: hypothetical protein JWO86_5579 [Myxococcaceae bacterium]|jgi:hypothetical protein|nr:hypothetical protein [Myxococcaceae bacterium]MEA2751700.1 hypothetical protein [Myxococcales bacterium]
MDEATNLLALAPLAASRSEDETLPEVAPAKRETQQFGRGRVIVHLLADIRAKLAPLPQGKLRRALTNKLESLQYVVDAWAALIPAPEQVSAMLEVLLALQETADDASASAQR